MNIIQAITDPQVFRPFFGDNIATWRPWFAALRAVYGLPIKSQSAKRLVKRCTGRAATRLPQDGFDTALFLTGRRSGKSRMAAVIAAYEATLAGRTKRLSAGERGLVPVISPTRSQSRIVANYLRAIFESTAMLRNEVAHSTKEMFELKNGATIEILTGDWRTVRGHTLLAAVVDEVCFFGVEETKVKSDTELIRALKPGLASTGGKLIAISSPYGKRGWSFQQFEKCHGNKAGRTLVWNAPSRVMNRTLPQRIIDAAMREDRIAAQSEYGGQFRDDLAAFIDLETVRSAVVKHRTQLSPQRGTRYVAFADLSGGRGDDATLAIAHKDEVEGVVVIDILLRWRPPFQPTRCCKEMAKIVKRYGCNRVAGDAYAGEFVASAFRNAGVRYLRCKRSKSELYLELLPILSSGEVELPDDSDLVKQLSQLERRTRPGGRDVIDHPRGQHDDLANSVAGVTLFANQRRKTVGGFGGSRVHETILS